MGLSQAQINTLETIERSNASVSVVSTLILLTTFCACKSFRSLSNTLIFYASFANLFANVAALIGRSAIHNPDGALCQFQAFLLEMFMQSDPLWSCAMAINVYLCFFRRFDQIQLKRMNWIYGVICYGIPFIPAMFCLFYRDARGKMYGDATLWCWIGNAYPHVRIYSYYLPIWIAILISLSIYLRVGVVIYKVRAQIIAFEKSSRQYAFNDTAIDTTSRRQSNNTAASTTYFIRNKKLKEGRDTMDEVATVTEDENVGGGERWDSIAMNGVNTGRDGRLFDIDLRLVDEEIAGSNLQSITNHTSTDAHPHPHPHIHQHSHHHHHHHHHHPQLSPLDPTYTHPSHPFFHHQQHPTTPPPSPTYSQYQSQYLPSNSRPASRPMDKLKIAYTKSALLFTISILITWVPASINRVHGWTHPRDPSFALNVMSAFVLPLQGFWNTVIFFSTSWGVVRRALEERGWRRERRRRRSGMGRESRVGSEVA